MGRIARELLKRGELVEKSRKVFVIGSRRGFRASAIGKYVARWLWRRDLYHSLRYWNVY